MESYTNQDAHNDITGQFKLFKRNKTTREERLLFTSIVTERYFNTNGEYPSSSVLDRLGTLILQDELADMNEHKMSHNEYPLLSERQQERRHGNEKSMKAAQDVAVDGIDYRVRTRDSNRIMREIFRG